jgi:hypothetical protein
MCRMLKKRRTETSKSCKPGVGLAHSQRGRYEVEMLRHHRVTRDSKLEFRVKWKGWLDEDNTWEPEANLLYCFAPWLRSPN